MKLEKKEDTIDAAGCIILKSGIIVLSIEVLELEMGKSHKELFMNLMNDKDIMIMLLLSLESEIQQIIKDVAISNQSPEEELQNLFRSLNQLFERKPFYLDLIFDKHLEEKYFEIPEIINRIIKRAESYLLQVINKGKQERIFQAGTKSSYLANRILASFRLLMNEQRVAESLFRDFALLKSKSNAD